MWRGISEFYDSGWGVCVCDCVCVAEFCLGEPEECPCGSWQGKKELLSLRVARCP